MTSPFDKLPKVDDFLEREAGQGRIPERRQRQRRSAVHHSAEDETTHTVGCLEHPASSIAAIEGQAAGAQGVFEAVAALAIDDRLTSKHTAAEPTEASEPMTAGQDSGAQEALAHTTPVATDRQDNFQQTTAEPVFEDGDLLGTWGPENQYGQVQAQETRRPEKSTVEDGHRDGGPQLARFRALLGVPDAVEHGTPGHQPAQAVPPRTQQEHAPQQVAPHQRVGPRGADAQRQQEGLAHQGGLHRQGAPQANSHRPRGVPQQEGIRGRGGRQPRAGSGQAGIGRGGFRGQGDFVPRGPHQQRGMPRQQGAPRAGGAPRGRDDASQQGGETQQGDVTQRGDFPGRGGRSNQGGHRGGGPRQRGGPRERGDSQGHGGHQQPAAPGQAGSRPERGGSQQTSGAPLQQRPRTPSVYTGATPITDFCPCTLNGHECRHPQICLFQKTCWDLFADHCEKLHVKTTCISIRNSEPCRNLELHHKSCWFGHEPGRETQSALHAQHHQTGL